MKKILIADDSPTFLTLERTFLRDFAAEVLTAKDGIEALRLARTQHPDLILLDVEMPGMGGLEVLRVLHADGAFATTPIVMISSLTGAERAAEAKAMGAAEYLTKPISRPLLRATIARLLGA